MATGCVGELLVQIRLLQYGVQAAPPISDSGNDLIAVNGEHFRAISVRTTTTGRYTKPPKERAYNVLAVVHLVGADRRLHLDQSEIYLVPREDVGRASLRCDRLGEYRFSRVQVEEMFGNLAP